MTPLETTVIVAYYAALTLLVFYGVHRLALVVAMVKHGEEPAPAAVGALPSVTVQLPMYNERYVARRLIRAAAALDYPAELLEIQVLDDSDDETVVIVDETVAELVRSGVRAVVVRRADRSGYKAGALDAGLASATGELIAVFDADFVPNPDFLHRLVGHFDDSAVGMVQARWGYLNRHQTLLTQAQSVLLDGHFVVEQTARARSGAMFNFNGTAGIWRRQAIEDAGGWEHDTITEDLDLSYRAQLAGWRFVYRTDVEVPSELPEALTAFKSQQHRWAKGSIECLKKLGARVFRAGLPVRVRFEAFAHLCANMSYLLILLVAVAMPLQTAIRQRHPSAVMTWADMTLFAVGLVGVVAFYGAALRRVGVSRLRAVASIPLAVALDIGLCLHKSRAVVEALAGHRTGFIRTPKTALVGRRVALVDGYLRRSASAGVGELLMAAWMVWGLTQVGGGPYPSLLPIPFLALFAIGFALVGLTAVAQSLARPAPLSAAAVPDAAE